MLLLVTLPDEEYKRIVKAPRAVTPNEAFNQRIALLNVIKKAKPINKDYEKCLSCSHCCHVSENSNGEIAIFCDLGVECLKEPPQESKQGGKKC